MDAGTSRYKRPGQVGGPLGMPESMRSQMLSELGAIDVTAETPINQYQQQQQQQQYQQQPQNQVPMMPQINSHQYQQQMYMQQRQQQPYPQAYPPNGLYPQQRPYSPVPMMQQKKPPMAASRRSSIVSTSSGMNRFFSKKPWKTNSRDDDFADDEGVDIDGTEMSFNDLQHIRDRGRYGLRAPSSLDVTTPYIPTVGSKPLGSTPLAKGQKLSNTEYRKQLTAAKKMLYAQASNPAGSRALTLQGDPRVGQFQQNYMLPLNDPRAMSLNTSAVPLGNPYMVLPPQLGPRAMSLTNVGPRFVQNPNMQMAPQQQQQPIYNGPPRMNGDPRMRSDPRLNSLQNLSGSDPRLSSLSQNSGSPRLNSLSQLSGSFDSVHKMSFPGRYSTSGLNSANTSQQSVLDEKLLPGQEIVTPTSKSRFAPDEIEPVSSHQQEHKRTLKKISFTSPIASKPVKTTSVPEGAVLPPKESPLKSLESTYSVDSGNFNPKAASNNNQKLYSLSKDNENANSNNTQTEVFFTASQFSLQNIEEEGRSLLRDGTLKAQNAPLESHPRSTDITKKSSLLSGKLNHTRNSSSSSQASSRNNKRSSFIKRISFGAKSKPQSKAVEREPPAPVNIADEFQYNQPTMGRQIRDFSFGSETEVLRTAPLESLGTHDDVGSSVISLDNGADRSSDQISVGKIENVKSAERVSMKRVSVTNEVPRLNLTVDQLGIMQSNSNLLQELEMVSNELAGSISREFELDSKIQMLQKGVNPSVVNNNDSAQNQIISQAGEIAKLVNELANERKKRYIAEEHVLRWENGAKPSSLDLNYQNSEMNKKLKEQNEIIKEYKSKLDIATNENVEFVAKIKTLQAENNDFKGDIIPNLENQITILENNTQYDQLEAEYGNLKLENEKLKAQADQIKSIEDQKQALRHALKSMKEDFERQLRLANDKIRNLELQQQKTPQQGDYKKTLKFDDDNILNDFLDEDVTGDESHLKTPTPTPTKKSLPVVFN